MPKDFTTFDFNKDVTLGMDPEYPLIGQDGSSVPAWLVTKGTKENHESIQEGIRIHADGAALEITTPPFTYKNFRTSVKSTVEAARQFSARMKLGLGTSPEVTNFSKEVLRHPLCATIGCDPDYSAYSTDPHEERKVPFDPLTSTSRFFGGHIHIGYPQELLPPWAMARVCDLIITLPILEIDRQAGRRQVYGLAGLYRPKSYGVEYRTPCNAWTFKNNAIDVIENNIRNFFYTLKNHPTFVNQWFNEGNNWKGVQDIISKEDLKASIKYFQSSVRNKFADYGAQLLSHE